MKIHRHACIIKILILLLLNITFTHNRKIDDDFWHQADDPRPNVAETLNEITQEVKDIREGLADSPINDEDEYYGDNNYDEYYRDNESEENKDEEKINPINRASSKQILYEDPKLTQYKAFLMKLSRVNNYEDLKREFNYKEPVTFKRTDDSNIPLAPFSVPKCADEKPRNMTIPIDFISSTHYIYPNCLVVKRCLNVGCCKLPHQECGAEKVTKKQVKVYKISHSKTDPVPVSIHVVSYEEHEKCECMCKKKADECKLPHVLNAQSCRCECSLKPKNNCGVRKQWSSNNCACVCTDKNPTCDSTEVWNSDTCLCEKAPTCPTATILDLQSCQCR